METFSALLAIFVGNAPVPGEFPAQRPVTRSFDGFIDLRLNKQMSKQSRGGWFETLSHHYDIIVMIKDIWNESDGKDFSCYITANIKKLENPAPSNQNDGRIIHFNVICLIANCNITLHKTNLYEITFKSEWNLRSSHYIPNTWYHIYMIFCSILILQD